VATFYRRLMAELAKLDISVDIHKKPNEVPEPIRFDLDETHKTYELSMRIGSGDSGAGRSDGLRNLVGLLVNIHTDIEFRQFRHQPPIEGSHGLRLQRKPRRCPATIPNRQLVLHKIEIDLESPGSH